MTAARGMTAAKEIVGETLERQAEEISADGTDQMK